MTATIDPETGQRRIGCAQQRNADPLADGSNTSAGGHSRENQP